MEIAIIILPVILVGLFPWDSIGRGPEWKGECDALSKIVGHGKLR